MSDKCSDDCGERRPNNSQPETESLILPPNRLSRIGHVVGVVSGKGGVGKSLVTALLASAMRRRGYRVGLMDADVTGPSISRLFGLKSRATMDEGGIYPVKSQSEVDIISLNLLIEDESDPVIWRGPVISGLVRQFWTDVVWGEKDFLFIDMPPGTGDVPLTVFQSIPLDGLIVVNSPQELVGLIVEKALKMARLMKAPLLALVENMSYFLCPDCGRQVSIFGESRLSDSAARYQIGSTGRLPLDPALAKACDAGQVENLQGPWLDDILSALEILPSLPPKGCSC